MVIGPAKAVVAQHDMAVYLHRAHVDVALNRGAGHVERTCELGSDEAHRLELRRRVSDRQEVYRRRRHLSAVQHAVDRRTAEEGEAGNVGLLEMDVLEMRRRLVVGEGYEGATELQPNRIQRVVERGGAQLDIVADLGVAQRD